MNFLNLIFLIFTFSFTSSVFAKKSFDLFIETGTLWQTRNDTQISPSTGTHFEIDNFNKGPFFHYRIEAYYRINHHHSLRLVYAPSEIKVSGQIDQPVTFNDQTFSPTENLSIFYRFNSYRLSYLFGFWGFGNDQINLGLTAKIRDAVTTFSQTSLSSSYDNIGFVPLLYFEYQKSLSQNWLFNLTLDAAAAPQGRAVDAALKLRWLSSDHSSLGLGVRTLEGGADNDKVFTFSWFNYAVFEFKTSF